VDQAAALIYGMDLTKLMNDLDVDIAGFIQEYIRRFEEDIMERIKKYE
jgi:hypothetical protein